MKTFALMLSLVPLLGCTTQVTTIAYNEVGYGTPDLITFQIRSTDFDKFMTRHPVTPPREPATHFTHFATVSHRGQVMKLYIDDNDLCHVVAEVGGETNLMWNGFACDLPWLQTNGVGKVSIREVSSRVPEGTVRKSANPPH